MRMRLNSPFFAYRWLLQNCMHEFSFATKTWKEIQATGFIPSVRSCPAWAKDDTHVVSGSLLEEVEVATSATMIS
jgi:hypothetical protein